MRKDRPVIDLIGQTFGYLTVLRYEGKNKHNKCLWECVCKCGNKIIAIASELKSGHTKSCSCLQKEKAAAVKITHGLSIDPYKSGYSSWANIKSRCRNKNCEQYKSYGAIGIIMCDRWYDSFENFIADMGQRPSLNHSVDRYPNKNGNYEPNNCRWATPEQQMNNTNRNVWLEYNGIKMTQSQWAKRWDIYPSVIIQHMVKYGRSFEYVYNYYENRA